MVQHVLFWAAATTFAQYDRVDTGLRFPMSFALGLTLLAAFCAARVASATGKSRGVARFAYVSASVVVLALLALHSAYTWTAGRLHAQAIEAILQTDLTEALGYLATQLGLLWGPLWAVSVTLFWLTLPTVPGRFTRHLWVQAPLLLASAALLYMGRGVITQPIEHVNGYRAGTAQLRQALEEWKARPHPAVESSFEGTVIVVLGESTSRHHMSLYGYPRETTPNLLALRPELAVFEDVIANESSTIDSVTAAFTLQGGPDGTDPHENAVGVLQLADAAGFETVWLSNQNEFGVWDNPVRILAAQAHRVQYHDTALGKLSVRTVFDEAMLPGLDIALAENGVARKLIVLHLQSTHAPYCWTKPPSFDRLEDEFGKRLYGNRITTRSRIMALFRGRANRLDCYYNGVRYVDAMLDAVVSRARSLPGPSAVLFFSDHGEAPLLGTGHDGAMHSAYHIEIPMILWANTAFRDAYPDTWESALANRTKPFSLKRMAPTLVDLMRLETPLLRRKDSLLNPAYRPRQRFAIGGRIRYDSRWHGNDYRQNSRVFVRELAAAASRVWAHRVNSLGALLEAKRTFSGVEIDVHYDSEAKAFQVRHEYADIGLTFRDMLEWSRDRPDMKIWLDWKNADAQNVKGALSILLSLDREFGLKQRLLVETDSFAVSPELSVISKAGFHRGYYLPADRIAEVMSEGGAATDRLAREIERVVRRGGFEAVTYDAELQPFVAAKLDGFLTAHGIRRYSWDLSIDSGEAASDPAAVAATVRERDLEALLVRFPSDFRI